MILLHASLAAKPAVSEYGSRDVAAAIAAAAADATIAGSAPSLALVNAITTQFGATTGSGVKVFIEETSPTKAQVLAALDAIRAQVEASNRYT